MPTMSSSPIVKVICSAASCAKPTLTKRCCRSGAMPLAPVHTSPCEKPSKLVVPIITHSSATVPGTGSRRGAPASGARRKSVRSRQCSGASIENS